MAGEIQLNGTSFASESNGTITVSSDVVFPSFVGMVAAFAISSAPSGWLVCNGGEYAIAQYGDLFTAIGTTWGGLTDGFGGAGSTHFRVPDLSGAFLRGSGTQTYTNTYNGGSVGDKSVDSFKSHTHSVDYYNSGGGSKSAYGGDRFTINFTGTTNTAGGTETKPFSVTILYCIKH